MPRLSDRDIELKLGLATILARELHASNLVWREKHGSWFSRDSDGQWCTGHRAARLRDRYITDVLRSLRSQEPWSSSWPRLMGLGNVGSSRYYRLLWDISEIWHDWDPPSSLPEKCRDT
jgi:hypothetical protein